MTPEQIDRLINLVITLGGKAATEGFAIALRRVTYLAITELVGAVAFTVVGCFCLYLAQLCWRKHIECKDGDYHYDNEWGIGCWGIRIMTVVLWVIVALSLLTTGFDKLINPEWHAVMMLFGVIGG